VTVVMCVCDCCDVWVGVTVSMCWGTLDYSQTQLYGRVRVSVSEHNQS